MYCVFSISGSGLNISCSGRICVEVCWVRADLKMNFRVCNVIDQAHPDRSRILSPFRITGFSTKFSSSQNNSRTILFEMVMYWTVLAMLAGNFAVGMLECMHFPLLLQYWKVIFHWQYFQRKAIIFVKVIFQCSFFKSKANI